MTRVGLDTWHGRGYSRGVGKVGHVVIVDITHVARMGMRILPLVEATLV